MCKMHVCTHELLLVSKFTLLYYPIFRFFFFLLLAGIFLPFSQNINDPPGFRIELEVRKILTNSLLHSISFLPREM